MKEMVVRKSIFEKLVAFSLVSEMAMASGNLVISFKHYSVLSLFLDNLLTLKKE